MIENTLIDFTKKLLNESFQGIILGELENQKVILELEGYLTLSLSDFISKFFTEKDIRLEIISIFPVLKNSNITSVDVSSSYIPSDGTIPENPQIKNLIDYSMIFNTDYIQTKNGFIITEQGYKNIFNKISNNMVAIKKGIIREFLRKGKPSLIVDSGNINTKVLLSSEMLESSGLNFKLVKYSDRYNNETYVISKGISENLNLPLSEFKLCDIAFLTGYIYIEKSEKYKFIVEANDLAILSIDQLAYKNEEILLSKGMHDFYITYHNSYKAPYSLKIFLKEITSDTIIEITGKILYTTSIISKNNFSYSLMSNFKDENGSIIVKTLNSNNSISINPNGISEITLNYKIINE